MQKKNIYIYILQFLIRITADLGFDLDAGVAGGDVGHFDRAVTGRYGGVGQLY